jgi:hypothetical protein
MSMLALGGWGRKTWVKPSLGHVMVPNKTSKQTKRALFNKSFITMLNGLKWAKNNVVKKSCKWNGKRLTKLFQPII